MRVVSDQEGRLAYLRELHPADNVLVASNPNKMVQGMSDSYHWYSRPCSSSLHEGSGDLFSFFN